MNLDEELAIEINPWRGRLITIGVLAGIAIVIGVVVWAFFIRSDSPTLRLTEDLVVGRATINANLIISGVAEAQLKSDLTFRATGRVETINVAVGDVVKEGDVLAALESDSLDNAVASAQAGLAASRARLANLLEGATDAELANAGQNVVQAETALNNATRDLNDLLDGPGQARIAADIQAVTSAEVGLNEANRALQDLRDGATDVQISNANQAVVSAQAGVDQAQRDRQDLLDGATDAQIAQGEQALASAEASLASAEATLESVTSGPDDAAVAAAESQIAAAEQGIINAEVGQQNALAAVDTAEAALLAAVANYCDEVDFDFLCISPEVPLLVDEVNGLLDDLADLATDPLLLPFINAVIQANSGYVSALNGVGPANESLGTAQAALDAAQANLAAVLDGPSDEAVTAAEAAVAAAQEGIALAQLNLDELLEGPDADDIARVDDAVLTAQAALDAAITAQEDLLSGADDNDIARAEDNIRSAQAALDAAQARLDDVLDDPESIDVARARDAQRVAQAAVDAARAALADTEQGARETVIEQQRQSVRTAELSVQAALIRLEDSQIISPFDGTVATVNLTIGEFASSAVAAPIVLLTPNLVVLEMSIGETDYTQVKLDQTGIALFDALPGVPFPFRVTEIGLAPSVNQGVVTYPISGALVISPDGPRPSSGMSANGQIITESRPDVLAIPPRAIRRSGGNQVVDVRRDGEVVEQVVTTGASDNNNVEILEGLAEGDIIVLPALATGRRGGEAPDPTLPAGIR